MSTRAGNFEDTSSHRIDTGLSGVPFWGTDIGGFVPTSEFTAELYLRWFQFGAFVRCFRCHGRAWSAPALGMEYRRSGPRKSAAIRKVHPDASQLAHPEVELICRKYLDCVPVVAIFVQRNT